MSEPSSPHKAYRVLLRLYPKAHRREYGEQMVQTLDDMLSERESKLEEIAVWLRIGRELPLNVIEEHINNLEEVGMGNLQKVLNKRVFIGIGSVIVIILLIGGFIIVHRSAQYTPTTYAKLQEVSSKPTCLQMTNNTKLNVDSKDATMVGNVITTSVIDAHAGTNVNVNFKTYTGTEATGTASYSSYYGNYNFTVKKVASDSTNSFVGGWEVIRFQACKT